MKFLKKQLMISGTKIEVIKNYGKSRHWRLFQGVDENFALVRNGYSNKV